MEDFETTIVDPVMAAWEKLGKENPEAFAAYLRRKIRDANTPQASAELIKKYQYISDHFHILEDWEREKLINTVLDWKNIRKYQTSPYSCPDNRPHKIVGLRVPDVQDPMYPNSTDWVLTMCSRCNRVMISRGKYWNPTEDIGDRVFVKRKDGIYCISRDQLLPNGEEPINLKPNHIRRWVIPTHWPVQVMQEIFPGGEWK